MSCRRALAFALFAASALIWSRPAAAQGFGIGPRMSFVRGDVPSATPSTRFFGGTMRMSSSKHVVFEVAMDYRSQLSDDGLTRLRERPLQGSLLLFPARSTFSPYLLAGYGLYQQTTDYLDGPVGLTSTSVMERKTGAHVGFGAEVFLSRHTAFFLDYRYRFVKFGTPDPGADPINIPLVSDKVQLSHTGSMITSGMAFYF
ncbi:MAG: outer membrane beta-barrel protein [Acidobacteriota bacterium]